MFFLLSILCFFNSALVVDSDRWLDWNVNENKLYAYDAGWRPLKSTANLADFTAIMIKNFDGRLNSNISELETKFPNLTLLRLVHCDVATINQVFAGKIMRNIRKLRISSYDRYACPNVDIIPEITLADSFPLLERLEVKGHNLKTTTKPIAFSPNLQEIELYNNRLVSLDFTTFSANVNLQVLSLGTNRLTDLPEQIFQRNVKLQVLYFNYNELRSLPGRLLMHLSNLEKIDVSKNEIDAIPPQFFASNRKLQILIFDSNRIKRLSPKLFKGLFELRTISFIDNQIKSLSAGLFKDCRIPTSIWFRINQINKISPNAFHKAASYKYSDFSDNPCTKGTDSSDISKCIANWKEAAERMVSGESI